MSIRTDIRSRPRSPLAALLTAARPKQWTKNLIVFAPLLFAAELTDPTRIVHAIVVFAAFCLLSAATYLVNDILDADRDRQHERKRLRPVAAGELSTRTAWIGAATLTAAGLAPAFMALNWQTGVVASGFMALQLAYNLYLRDQVILDVMAISGGFVLRAIAGATAIAVPFSHWLLMCTALLALFLALAKRRHELLLLEDQAADHRASLRDYTPAFIDEMVSAVTSGTLVTYALYTFFSTTGEQNEYLMFTTPFVAYGLFRYLFLVHRRNLGSNPEEILLSDWPLLTDIGLWLVAVVAAMSLS